MIFHWILSDSKSPQVSWTLRSILAKLINAAAWMVSTHPLIFKFSSHCTNPFLTVPSTRITIGITITFMFHSFSLLKLGLGTYLSFCFLSVLLAGQLEWQKPGSLFFVVDCH